MKSFEMDVEWIPGALSSTSLNIAHDDSNKTVGERAQRRILHRATSEQRGVDPGCVPQKMGGLAGRLRVVWPAHGVQMGAMSARGGGSRTWRPFGHVPMPQGSGAG